MFDWTSLEQGLILGSYFYGYFLTQIPGGRLAEVSSAKWTFGGAVLANCGAALLSPVAAAQAGISGEIIKLEKNQPCTIYRSCRFNE